MDVNRRRAERSLRQPGHATGSEPLPKLNMLDATASQSTVLGLVEPEASKATVSGALPVVGDACSAATGASLTLQKQDAYASFQARSGVSGDQAPAPIGEPDAASHGGIAASDDTERAATLPATVPLLTPIGS